MTSGEWSRDNGQWEEEKAMVNSHRSMVNGNMGKKPRIVAVKDFRDLDVWKAGRALRQRFYGLSWSLPDSERFNLIQQIRRAAVSLTANLAEGYGRYHFKENIQHCRVSRGSAYELLDHLVTCQDEGYIPSEEFESFQADLMTFMRLINGYIRSIGKAGNGQESSVKGQRGNGEEADQ